MPADFLLSTLSSQVKPNSAASSADLFQIKQADSSVLGQDFRNEFQREVQRTSYTRRQESHSSASHNRASDAASERREPATASNRSERSGNSLPGSDNARQIAKTDDARRASDDDAANAADANDKRAAAEQRRAQEAEVGAVSESQQQKSQHQSEELAEQQQAAAASAELAEQQQAAAASAEASADRKLVAEQRQALEALRYQLRGLQLDQMDAAKQQQLAQWQHWAEGKGLDLGAIAEQLNGLTQQGSFSSAELEGLLKQMGGSGADSVSDLLSQLQTLVSQGAELLNAPSGSAELETQSAAAQDPQALLAALENLQQWLDQMLQRGFPVAMSGSGGQSMDLAGEHSRSGVGQDLSPLLNGKPLFLTSAGPGASAGAEGFALSWRLTAAQPAQAGTAASTLTDRISALSPSVLTAQGEDSDASGSKAVDNGVSGLMDDMHFLAKHSDKLSAKAKASLGELNLLDLANQAQQLAKEGAGPLQQKIQDVVAQLKSAMGESTKADTAALDSASRSSGAQPVSAFQRSLEQAGAPQTAKMQMTMQNHFRQPAWAGELGQRLMMMVGQKIQVAEIRLDPPDLGPMEVKVRMHQEQAHVVFQSQHAAVRDALEQAIPRLRELFDQSGVGLGNVDVQDQTAQQRQGDDEEASGQWAGGDGLDSDAGMDVDESLTVTASDRLVDYYA